MKVWLTCAFAMGAMGCATPMAPRLELGAPLAPSTASADEERAQAPSPESGLEALVAHATRHHPSLARDHARWRAQSAQAAATGRWPEPRVGYTFAPLPIETRLGPNRHTFTASQRIPWPSGVERAQRAEGAKARALARRVDASYVAVRLEVERAYWSLWAIERRRRVLAREIVLLEALEAGVQARVETGARPASELARIGLRRVRLADRLEALEARERALAAELGASIGLDAAHRPSFEEALAHREPPPPDLEETIASTPTPPHLLALTEEIATRRAQREAAEVESMPSFELGAQWSLIDEGDATHAERGRDAVMMRVGVSLPIWSESTDARIDAADARVVEAQASMKRARQAWTARLRATHARAWDAHRRIRLIEGTLLTQAQSTLELVRGDYEVERADFSALLGAVDALFELELELVAQRAELELRVSEWDALLGHPTQEAR